mgnify:CR=1 FL=1
MKQYYTEKQLKELVSHIVILHDTAEKINQHILDYFDKKGIKHKGKSLKTGDYSFMIEACPELGFARDTYFTDELCIERKNSVSELAGNIKEKDERFLKELNRMINIEHCYLLIENDSIDDIIEHNYESQYNELAFFRQFIGMQKRSNLYTYFISRSHMGFMIYEICYSCLMNKILK